MFYKVIEKFSDIVIDYSVSDFRKYGSTSAFVAKVVFTNNSILFIRDYLFLNGQRKYSYHWQDANGSLILRWDNSPHHKEISTFPHHKHFEEKITESHEYHINDIFKTIYKKIKN